MAIDIGVCVHRNESAGSVAQRARQAEALGFAEIWLIEDCFYTAGVTLAAAALSVTDTIGVGLGIMPVVARNPAIAAMEIATLAELAPGRFHAGLGHGVQSWMAQMGARVDSPLTALDETFEVVQRLLTGETLSFNGRYVTLDGVGLELPPSVKPLVSAGVRGAKSLAVAARRADGVVLADFCSADYVRDVKGTMARVAPGAPRITVFGAAAIADEAHSAVEMRTRMSPTLAEIAIDAPPSLRAAPFFSELEAESEKVGWRKAIEKMPADWWRQISAVGDPEDARAYLDSLEAAGAEAVAFFPDPDDPFASTAQLADAIGMTPRRNATGNSSRSAD